MKHLLWLFLLIPLVCYGADSKITDLPDVGASSDDVMYVVDNPGTSTASDRKVTLGNLLLFFATQDITLTGAIDLSGATLTLPASITVDLVGDVTGNADTATALAANPSACDSGKFASDIAANGALTCAYPEDLTATASEDVVIKLGDNAAANKLSITDSDGAEIANIDSNGSVTITNIGTGLVEAASGVLTSTTTLSTTTFGGFEASKPLASDGSGNATTLSSQNVVTTGLISGLMPTVVYGADGALNVSQAQARANTFFVNTYAGTQVMTLPAAEAGMAVCIRNGQNNSRIIQVHSDGTDFLVVPSTGIRMADASKHFAATASPANQICLVAVDTTDWYVTSATGTWTAEE